MQTRRRFIAISAAALLPVAASFPAASVATPDPRRGATWRGVALGAAASIRIEGMDRHAADRVLRDCALEIERLEALFSLYRTDSALSRLNRSGRLDNPPADLLRLLSVADAVHRTTQGAFDPSVQPLWRLYAEHFNQSGGVAVSGPEGQKIETVLRQVGFGKVAVSETGVRFDHQGMALTLNGIAQGYITDRVADLLRAHGLAHVLIDLGEIRALGTRGDGEAWQVGIAAGPNENRPVRTVDLAERAIATSATAGTVFDEGSHYGHILDPRTGYPAPVQRQISVIAANATLADAYSTAFCLLDPATCDRIAADLDLRIIRREG